MDPCIVNVEGGTLAPEEIEAYKNRALDLYGRLPCRIDARIVGDEVELRYHFTYRPVVYRGIRSTLEVFDDEDAPPDRPFCRLPSPTPRSPAPFERSLLPDSDETLSP